MQGNSATKASVAIGVEPIAFNLRKSTRSQTAATVTQNKENQPPVSKHIDHLTPSKKSGAALATAISS